MEKEIVLQKTTETCEVSWKMNETERIHRITHASAIAKELLNEVSLVQRRLVEFTKKLSDLARTSEVVSEHLRTGYEMRVVDCERRVIKRKGEDKSNPLISSYHVQVIHPQTGEVLKESLATDADLQQPLFGVTE